MNNNQNGLSRREFIGKATQAGVGLAALNVINTTAKRAKAQDSVWSVLGDKMTGRPAVFRNANGQLEVFIRREDPRNSVWTNRQKDENGASGWEGWEGYDDSFVIRNVSAGLAPNGDVVVALVDKNNMGKIAVRRDNQWLTPFSKLQNAHYNACEGDWTVARLGSGELAVVIRTISNSYYYNKLTKPETGTWSGFGNIPQWVISGVAVAAADDGGTFYFSLAKDKKLQQAYQPPNALFAYKYALSAPMIGDPVVAAHSDGILEVFCVSDDTKTLWRRRQTEKGKPFEGDGDWVEEGGLTIKGNVAVASHADRRLSIFARAEDGKIYHKPQKEADGAFDDWGPWEAGTTKFNDDPVAVTNADGSIEVFVRGNDAKLYHTKQKGPNGDFYAPNVA